jgi:hypothetical protein
MDALNRHRDSNSCQAISIPKELRDVKQWQMEQGSLSLTQCDNVPKSIGGSNDMAKDLRKLEEAEQSACPPGRLNSFYKVRKHRRQLTQGRTAPGKKAIGNEILRSERPQCGGRREQHASPATKLIQESSALSSPSVPSHSALECTFSLENRFVKDTFIHGKSPDLVVLSSQGNPNSISIRSHQIHSQLPSENCFCISSQPVPIAREKEPTHHHRQEPLSTHRTVSLETPAESLNPENDLQISNVVSCIPTSICDLESLSSNGFNCDLGSFERTDSHQSSNEAEHCARDTDPTEEDSTTKQMLPVTHSIHLLPTFEPISRSALQNSMWNTDENESVVLCESNLCSCSKSDSTAPDEMSLPPLYNEFEPNQKTLARHKPSSGSLLPPYLNPTNCCVTSSQLNNDYHHILPSTFRDFGQPTTNLSIAVLLARISELEEQRESSQSSQVQLEIKVNSLENEVKTRDQKIHALEIEVCTIYISPSD